jgi:hypothetical protein
MYKSFRMYSSEFLREISEMYNDAKRLCTTTQNGFGHNMDE